MVSKSTVQHMRLLLSRVTCFRVVASILVLLGLYLLCAWVHQETYVWQCTVLAARLRPVQRVQCELPAPGSVPRDPLPLASPAPDPLRARVAVVTLFDEAFVSDSKLARRLLLNRERYCNKHGYTLLVVRGAQLDKSRPPAWSKLIEVRRHVLSGKFDYVVYMDMDAVITDQAQCLASLAARYPQADFIMAQDWSGPNTGVFIAKSSPFAAHFLQLAWDHGAKLVGKRCSVTGRAHPFEYEQRAVHFLLQTDAWRQRGLPKFTGASYDELPSQMLLHFAFVPQCAFNSYVMHPLDVRLLSGKADTEHVQWVPGDFMVHLAGKKGRFKADLLRHFLRIADRRGDQPAGVGADVAQ